MSAHARWGRRATRVAFALCFTLTAPRALAQPATSVPAAVPDPRKEAQERFQRGLALYKEGSLDAARIEFDRAYNLSPSFKILYNIGLVQRDKRDYRAALASFERFLVEGGKQIEVSKRREVEREIDTLRGFVGTLEIVTSPPGALVRVDDEGVGAGAMVVNAGVHRVTVTLDGYRDAIETVEIGGREARRLDITMAPLPSVEPKVIVKVEKETEKPSRWDATSFVLLAGSGVLAIGAGITGALAFTGAKEIESTTFAGDHPTSTIEAERDRVRALAISTDVLAGSAAALLAATFIYTYVHEPAAAKDAAPPPRVTVGLRGAGLAMEGTW